jgi:hypothetical protein
MDANCRWSDPQSFGDLARRTVRVVVEDDDGTLLV